MIYCRIKLSKTNYQTYDYAYIEDKPNLKKIQDIYKKYCDYKKFKSVQPLFANDIKVHKVMVYYDYILYIPNTFTPNNDGENDLFGPKGLRMNKYMNYQFIIYNRWGEEVFFTEDVSDKWSGEGSQDGVYNWVVIITDELGRVRKEVGEIMLIR